MRRLIRPARNRRSRFVEEIFQDLFSRLMTPTTGVSRRSESRCCILRCAIANCPRSSRLACWRAAHLRIMRGEMRAICIRTEQDRLWLCRSASPFSPFSSLSHSLILCSSHSPRSLVLRPPPLHDVPFFLFSSFLSFFFFNIAILNRPAQKGRQNEEWLNCTKLQVHEGILIITFAQAFRVSRSLFPLPRSQIRWIVNQYR